MLLDMELSALAIATGEETSVDRRFYSILVSRASPSLKNADPRFTKFSGMGL